MKPDGYHAPVRRLRRLREVREDVPLTQAELAARAQINRVTIVRLEGGAEMARPSTIRRLAKALGVKPQELYGDPES